MNARQTARAQLVAEQKTARQRLTVKEAEVNAALATLTAKLAAIQSHNATHTVHWPAVGDMTEVERRLAELVAFLGGAQ